MRPVKIHRIGQTGEYKHEIKLPEYLAIWDVWDYWERIRIDHMERFLTKNDIVFDVGTEYGAMTALWAKWVKGVCLMEPTPEMWGSIKAIWEANEIPTPLTTYCGLVGNEIRNAPFVMGKGWVKEADAPALTDKCGYKYIHEHRDLPQITIDEFVELSGIVPTALNIDIEGAELKALKGAENTLKNHKPKIWVSIHPDLAERDYDVKGNDLKEYLESLGYVGKHLATDHEEHWFFRNETERKSKIRAILIAGGEGTRWKNYKNLEKHFAEVDGEPIIQRTVRLLKENGVDDIWIVAKTKKYELGGTKLYIPKFTPEYGDADKFLSSKELWNEDGRTIVFYGDVFFTERAMEKIINHRHRDWLLFARPFASDITGCDCGECFAQSFYHDHIDEHRKALYKLVEYYKTGRLDRIGGWEHYRIMIGLPEEIIHRQLIGDRFVEINDWTEDFDTPGQYKKFIERYEERNIK